MDVRLILEKIEKMVREIDDRLAVPEIWKKYRDPFKVLVSTIISIRTKEEKTIKVCEKLFYKINKPEDVLKMPKKELENILRGVGLYKQKTTWIIEIAKRWDYSKICDENFIRSLPGVGRKVLNIYLNIVCGKNLIAVDTHVHRVSNRIGLVNTKDPKETEEELYKVIPKEFWSKINRLFVIFGRNICKPINPKCEICRIKEFCKYYKSKNNR